MRRRIAFAVLPCLLMFATLVWAGRNVEIYENDSTTAAYRTVSAADSPAQLADTAGGLSTVGQITTLTIGASPTVEISARASNASATLVIHLARYHWDGSTLTYQSSSRGTLTADAAITDGTGDYVTNSLVFDTGGSEVCKIVVEAPSAGDFDLWARRIGVTR